MTNNEINIKTKLPNIGTTIFAVMSKMANDHGAINLSQGFPDYSCSDELIRLVNKYMKNGYNQYAPMQGILPLREAIAEKASDLYDANVHPEKNVTVTSGGTEALYAAITAMVHEGDEVLLLEPCYDSYVPAVKLNGGLPIFIPLKHPDYTIDWEMVKRRITANTRMIILNSPHNPTGAAFTKKDMEELGRITAATDILILSDEVYEHIIFDGLEHESVLKYPSLAERSFVVFSFGKTYHATGWKVGYCIAPDRLMKEFRKVHQFIVFASPRPLQHALADFMQQKDEYLKLADFYQEKRDKFNQLMSETKFSIIPSKGTYFQLAGYSSISDQGDRQFSEWLTKEIGVAAIPVSVFYNKKDDHKVIRFCFAKSDKLLEQAAEKLIQVK